MNVSINKKQEDIEELAKKAKRGNKEAEEKLSRHHGFKKLMGATIRRYQVGYADKEAMQEFTMKVMQNLSNWHETASFTSWAWKIANSVCVDIIRKREKQKRIREQVKREKIYSGKKSTTTPDSIEGTVSLARLRQSNTGQEIENKEIKEKIKSIIDEIVGLNDIEINLYILTNKEWKSYFNYFLTIDIPISKFEAMITRKKSQIYNKAERGKEKFLKILKKYFSEYTRG